MEPVLQLATLPVHRSKNLFHVNLTKQNAVDLNDFQTSRIRKRKKNSSKIKIDLNNNHLDEWTEQQESPIVEYSRKTIYSKLHNSQEFPNWKYVALSNIFDN